MEYSVHASEYLSRARWERRTENPARLFYSALELRCGIEARLHEYRDAVTKRERDKTWQVRLLKRQVERLVDKFEKPVTIHLHNPQTGERMPLRYVPVCDELKSIAERLGDYLHSVEPAKFQHPQFLSKFTALIDRGLNLLSDATSGELLAPPIWQNNGKVCFIAFDDGKVPRFVSAGTRLKLAVTLEIVSRTHEGVIFKNASGKF